MELKEETKKKIEQLQRYEQNSQMFLQQKQMVQQQLMEIEAALSELKGSSESYKIVGNIMVKSSKEAMEKDLLDKKNSAELRIKSIEKQELSIRQKAKALQDEIAAAMKIK